MGTKGLENDIITKKKTVLKNDMHRLRWSKKNFNSRYKTLHPAFSSPDVNMHGGLHAWVELNF